jgi:predicted GTPase
MGAAGRDFHNFNCLFRNNPDSEVVAFTATQIPDIEGRNYPPALAGPLYPTGIPIVAESELERLVKQHDIDEVWFSYSDVSHQYVMDKGAHVIAWGANFGVCSATRTMLKSTKPVIAIVAVRTGVGKSQTTRFVSNILKRLGKRVVAIRHPMPYGDLAKQACQRFAKYEDLDKHDCTIEEREEYEPHIDNGFVVTPGRHERSSARGGGRRHPLGRRQQRHALLQARPAHHPARPAPGRPRAELLPGDDQLPDG